MRKNICRIKRFFKITTLLLFVACIVLALYAMFIEPRFVQVTRQRVLFENYPADEPPMKITLMGDFHCGPYMSPKRVRRIVRMSNREVPDVVLLDGDFVSGTAQNINSCAPELARLRTKRGTFAVLGNHDYWEGAEHVAKALRRNGIDVIINGNRKLSNGVWLVAMDDVWTGRPDPEAAFAGVPENAVRIALTHSPNLFPHIKGRNCLALTGHTHAGQIDIPGIPRNQLPGLLNFEYIRGWYRDGNSRLYVNRGLGVVNPPLRFRARPEITILTIARGKPDTSGMKTSDPVNTSSPVRKTFIFLMKRVLRIMRRVEA